MFFTSRPHNDYPGYAKDCVKESSLCFPLGTPETNVLFKRVENAIKFWNSWESDRWSSIQQSFLDAITTDIGETTHYYAIDGGHWPPKAMVKVIKEDITYIFTLSVSILPQPKVEQYTDEPESIRRFEFAAINTDRSQSRKNSPALTISLFFHSIFKQFPIPFFSLINALPALSTPQRPLAGQKFQSKLH